MASESGMDFGGHVAKLVVAVLVVNGDDVVAVLRGAVAGEAGKVRGRRDAVEAETVAFGAAARFSSRELNPIFACVTGHVEDVVVEEDGCHDATSLMTEPSSAR